MFSGLQREREKSNSTRCSASPRPTGGNADVVGLDVAVGDAFAFQEDDGLQQVFAEALEQVEAEPAFFADALAQGLVAGLVQEDGRAIAELKDAVAADDQRAVELLENLAFVADAVVVVGIDGDLGDELLVVLPDQQGGCRRTRAELPNDFITARQDVARLCMGGIADKLVARRGQFVFDLVEELDELGGGVEAVADIRVGAVLDQLVERSRARRSGPR